MKMRTSAPRKNTKSKRTGSGAVLAESTAAICLFFPVIFIIIFAIVEIGEAFAIRELLSQASREASRDLAIAYGSDPTIAGDRTQEDATVFSNIRITGVVANNAQFSDPVWNTTTTPNTVSVTVTYTPGQYGLAVFPQPDPIGLGKNFLLTASSTYRLE
jgi:Flp pilus assembly protein TadG